ncbi:unnamed protein product [Dovyalis caffra]|uniref:Uncharacterized protein n=1 Tax=Dovyalis caffra TaxID=77055 RepID=A0AAV1RPC0_9ROSI|nr:unnamed protein product [Dovyalis caffra]
MYDKMLLSKRLSLREKSSKFLKLGILPAPAETSYDFMHGLLFTWVQTFLQEVMERRLSNTREGFKAFNFIALHTQLLQAS